MTEDSGDMLRRAYRQAVQSLPPVTRAIFLAHRLDGENLALLAERYALSVDDVAGHLAAALIVIDQALRGIGR